MSVIEPVISDENGKKFFHELFDFQLLENSAELELSGDALEQYLENRELPEQDRKVSLKELGEIDQMFRRTFKLMGPCIQNIF